MSKGKKLKDYGITLMIILFGISLIAVILCLYLFKIRNLNVVGNRTVPKADFIELSGIKIGDNYLLLNKSRLKTRIESNRYLKFRSAQLDYSGTLTLRLNERHAMGILVRNGFYYVIDENGVVLENSGPNMPENVKCPFVFGLNLPDAAKILAGEPVGVMDKEQLVALSKVLKALDETNMLGRTASLDIGNLDNIYIMTTEQAQVVLGQAKDLTVKLVVAREVLHQRQEMENLTGARIDISNGYEAHYIPPVLPTVTPVPTATPTIEPAETPKKK
ncbi:MAG: FtsQ-type POTRA domain-containing protein [Clostridia bacterium]|nr:FtsQ-type POTRA domain-containing protein [Clostridia bacterium]